MVEVYSRLLAAHPNATDLYQRRAVCYLRIRDWNKAAADFQRVVEKLPQFGWNWYHCGIVALYQGNLPEYKKSVSGSVGEVCEVEGRSRETRVGTPRVL